MPQLSTLLRHAFRGLVAVVVSFAVWTTWLALTVLLGFQIYIAATHQLEIPAWVLRAMEQRLELYEINAKFGRTSFDPTGSLSFENVSIVLPSFNEPVVTAAGIFVRLDPWALLNRRFEPQEIRMTGASCLVPAMLSSSGAAEQLVRDFDVTLEPRSGGEILIRALSARVAGLSVNAGGTIYLPEAEPDARKPRAVAESIARRYAAACRQLMAAIEKLNAFDQPSATLQLVPSESRAAIAHLILTARGFKASAPLAASASGLVATAQFPILGDAPTMVRIEFTADEMQLPRDIRARGVRAAIRGPLTPSRFNFAPNRVELSAALVQAEGVVATAFAGHFTSDHASQLHGDLVANLMNSPLAVVVDADFSTKNANARFEGAIAPAWLDVVSRQVGTDVRRFVNFKLPISVADGEAVFRAGWKFDHFAARVEARSVEAYRVLIDAAKGRVELTPKRFFASGAEAHLGKNFARGSYEQLFPSQEFRFLLEGQLAPLDISGWFGPWWPNFFQTFQFPGGPPVADVDVAGRWGEGHRTTVFVYGTVNSPVIRGAALDYVRTRLFIRPGFYDGLEAVGTLGSGVVRGTFTYQVDPVTFDWKQFDFAGTSSLPLAPIAQLIGPISADWLEPFRFEQAPAVKISGRLERRAAEDYHQDVQITATSDGAFWFHDFPLERVAFNATLHDAEISLADVEAGFAGGATTGRAKIWGRGTGRKLNFDFALREASLGRAITILEQFVARKNGGAPPAPGKFIQEKNNVRLDLAGKAEGDFNDPYSYQGRGVGDLKGAELGELRLLGGLSESVRFTALRFTAANGAFRIEGPKLVFPDVSITGDNSAIQAHGEYLLDRKQLDFNAKLYPFQESGFVLKKILDVALSPLSNVFEVKLTGTLDKPSWGLVLGPSNFLRNLTQSGREDPPPAKPGDPTEKSPPALPPASGAGSEPPAGKP
ncbi:MAG: AsmA-like C-terminal region-containing protein [Opitutaceae bacterium]